MTEVTLTSTTVLPLVTMPFTPGASGEAAAPFATLLTALGESGATPAHAATPANPLAALLSSALPNAQVAVTALPTVSDDAPASDEGSVSTGSDDDQASSGDLSPEVQALLASLVTPALLPPAAPLPMRPAMPQTGDALATTLQAPALPAAEAQALPSIANTGTMPIADTPLPASLVAMLKQAATSDAAKPPEATTEATAGAAALATTAADASVPVPAPSTLPTASPSPAETTVQATTTPATIVATPVPSQSVDGSVVQAASASLVPDAIAPRETPLAPTPSTHVSTTAALGARVVPAHAATHTDLPRPATPARSRRTSEAAITGTAAPTAASRPEALAGATSAAPPADDPVARQLTVAQDGQWLDTLARDIAGAGGSDGRLSFRLDPHHLGSLSVQIEQRADGASVRLVTATETARALLADAQPQLMAEARAQGLHLRDATVETRAPGAAPNPGNTPAPAPTATSGTISGGTRGDGGSLAGQLGQQQQGQRGGHAGQRTPDQPPHTHPAPRAPARDGADLYA